MIAHMFQRRKGYLLNKKRIIRVANDAFFVESLNFHNDGKNHWATMRFLVEKFAQRMFDFILDE